MKKLVVFLVCLSLVASIIVAAPAQEKTSESEIYKIVNTDGGGGYGF